MTVLCSSTISRSSMLAVLLTSIAAHLSKSLGPSRSFLNKIQPTGFRVQKLLIFKKRQGSEKLQR